MQRIIQAECRRSLMRRAVKHGVDLVFSALLGAACVYCLYSAYLMGKVWP